MSAARLRPPPGTRRSLAGPLLLFALFGAAYIVPPQGSDRIVHLSGIIEARNALREWQFPPRVAPNLAGGERYPIFQFYGALPYGLAGALSLLPGVNAYHAWKIVTALSVTAAGFYMFRSSLALTRQVWPSIVAGVVFVTAPYLSTDFRARFAYTEAVSFCLLPAVFFFSMQAFSRRRWALVIQAGVAWAMLALSHNITNLYGSVLLGLFALSLVGPDLHKFSRRMGRVALAYCVGVLLTAWYVFPQLAVLDVIVMAADNAANTPHRSTIWAPLYAVLSPILTIAPEARNSPLLGVQAGWPVLAAALLGAMVVAREWVARATRRRTRHAGLHRPGAWMTARLLGAFALAFFIVWSPVDFWHYLPPLFYNLQITYRILMFVVLWGSLLAGMALARFWRRTRGGMPAWAAWVCIAGTAVTAMPFHGWGLTGLSSRTVKSLETQLTFGAAERQYEAVPARIERHRRIVAPGAGFMSSREVAATTQFGRVTRVLLSPQRPVVAQLPVRFYPGLVEVRDNSVPVAHFGHIDGLVAVDLSPGRHELEVRFIGLRWANWVSGITWFAVMAIAVAGGVAAVRRGLRPRMLKGQEHLRAPAFPPRAAAFGAMLLVVPMAVSGAWAHRGRKAAIRALGLALPSSEAFPGAQVVNAFDGDVETEWVTIPGPSAWLVVMPPAPRKVTAIELEPRQTDVLAGWHKVGVALYLGNQMVGQQTFLLPNAAREPLQVLTLDKAVFADGIELRFSQPVTLTRTGQRRIPPESCYAGYREIRFR